MVEDLLDIIFNAVRPKVAKKCVQLEQANGCDFKALESWQD